MRSPDDAAGMFDILTYTKGAAVLRMLEQYLGDERFRDGIRALPGRSTGSATPRPTTCGTRSRRATGEPVRRIMDGWIWQGGLPAGLGVGCGTARSSSAQRRFLLSGEDDDTVWDVPLLVRTARGPDRARPDRAEAACSIPGPDEGRSS